MATDTKFPDRIARMFKGSTILITGGTGYLGKVLIEKLLRCCPEIKTVYLLVRPKKGRTPNERLYDIYSNVLFNELKTHHPEAIKKCKIIPGDVCAQNLGLSPSDRKLLTQEVNFIFHSAASTRFDDSITVAVKMNTRGTKYVLDLAKECQHLKTFLHVSTAFAYPDQKVLHEKTYQPPADPEYILSEINFDEEDQSGEVDKLLGTSPNTYTFSKALAEGLVANEIGKLPILIVRPSVVCPTWRDPMPGWCNNLQGPMGLFVGAGKGVIRSMYMSGDTDADFIPADVVINIMLKGTYNYLYHDKSHNVINATASKEYNLSWEQIITQGKSIVYEEVPFNGILWYPGGSLKKSRVIHNVCFYLFQMLPAILIDALLMILGYKPLLFQIQRRIQKGGEMFEYFTNRNWNFDSSRSFEKFKQIANPREAEVYKTDAEGLVVRDYFKNCIMSVRRNNLKETDEMIPAAKRNMKIMWALDVFCKILFVAIGLHYAYKLLLSPILSQLKL